MNELELYSDTEKDINRYGYVVDFDEYGMVDYKSLMFFRSQEVLYVPYMSEEDVKKVAQVFMQEHEKFFSKLIEKFKEPFYSDSEILHDLQIFVYTFIFENRNKLNPFLEYHKSMCFLYVKKHMTNKFYELKHLYYQATPSNFTEQEDFSQSVFGISEKENYYSLDYEFEDVSKADLISYDLSNLSKFEYKLVSDLVDEESFLYFLITFVSKDKKLSPYLIEICYGCNCIVSENVYQSIKKRFKNQINESFLSTRQRSSLDILDQLSKEFDGEMIVIDSNYFHKRIQGLGDYNALYAWEKKYLNHFKNKKINLLNLFSKKLYKNKLLAKFIYFLYRNIYTPVGYISFYFPDTDILQVKQLPLDDSSFGSSVNKYYRF